MNFNNRKRGITVANFNKKNFFIYLFIFISFFTQTASTVFSENINFSMSAKLPDNQYNKEVTYFDLLVKPKEKQTLQLNVTNNGNDTKKIHVSPTNATTNSSGLIDYSIKKEDYTYDETLKIPFTSLVSNPQTIEVKPGETKKVLFDFQAPEEKFNGIILGGFLADVEETEDTKNPNNQENVEFVNNFQIVKAAVIRSSTDEVKPIIEMNGISTELYDNQAAIMVNLQNKAPLLLGNIEISTQIRDKKTQEIIQSETVKDHKLAPNSNFDFPIIWKNDTLNVGDYILDLSVKTNGEKFEFTKDFTITKEDKKKMLPKSGTQPKEKSNINIIIVASALGGLVVLGLIGLVVAQQRKNKRLAQQLKENATQKVRKRKRKSQHR